MIMMNGLLFVYIYLLVIAKVFSDDFPEVKIDQGVLRGKYRQTLNGKKINSFTGIPFAQPPVGELRFKPPQPAESWKGTLDATKDSPICPQQNLIFNDAEVKGDEDCLYLNVYTPQLHASTDKLLPVLFFIHGGGFYMGSAHLYVPDILLDKDVVLVTTHYRLGALGFISTEDEIVPGNMGLKDQNLALKWVKANINHFGGNPNKITVFGQSAGAGSAHYHVLSPLSRDLISGAIINSGNVLAPWALAKKGKALENTKRLAEFLNCPIKSNLEMVDCLSKVDASDIVAQEEKFYVFNLDPMITFRPVIEPEHENAFIARDPVEIIKRGESAKVPIMTGITTDEGAFKTSMVYSNSSVLSTLKKELNKLLPLMLFYEDHPKKHEITRRIINFYFGGKDIDDDHSKHEFTKLQSDVIFVVPHADINKLHVTYTDQPVYYFVFGFRGSFSLTQFLEDANYGACHGDELLYLLMSSFITDYNEVEKKYIDIMTTLWTNFATVGNPTPATNTLIKNKWEPIQKNKVLHSYFLKSIDDIKMENDMYKERIEFWKKLSLDYQSDFSKIRDEL